MGDGPLVTDKGGTLSVSHSLKCFSRVTFKGGTLSFVESQLKLGNCSSFKAKSMPVRFPAKNKN